MYLISMKDLPVLDYAKPDPTARAFRVWLLLSRLGTAIVLITCGTIETVNAKIGFVLPLKPPPPDGHQGWRAYDDEEVLATLLLLSVCWLYPLVVGLLITLPALARSAPTRRLRVAILIGFALVILAASTMFYRGYFSALLRAMD
jgi:hypothetical protein